MARPSTALSTDTEKSTASHSDDQAALKLADRKQAVSVADSCFEAEENERLANEHEPWMERFKSEDECGFLLPPRPSPAPSTRVACYMRSIFSTKTAITIMHPSGR